MSGCAAAAQPADADRKGAMMNSNPIGLGSQIEMFKAQQARARRTFGIGLTRKCHVACKHCINDSLPNRHDEVTPDQIRKLCRELAASGEFDTVNLTGGEPFEVFGLLVAAVDSIASFGLRPTVVTSASWAVSEKTAYDLLAMLVDRGLRALIVSRDGFHEPRVPHDNVAHALRAALARDIIAALNLTTGAGIKGRDELLAPIASRLRAEDFARVHIKEAELLRAGRASRLKRGCAIESDAEPHPLICNVSGPVLLESGQFAACCGIDLPRESPLQRGHCDTTAAGEMVQGVRKDPLVSMIRYFGLRRMAELLVPEYLDKASADFVESAQPADLCTVCVRILADPERVAHLRSLAQDPDIKHEMAVTAALLYGDNSLLQE
jgi:hypothetical protein